MAHGFFFLPLFAKQETETIWAAGVGPARDINIISLRAGKRINYPVGRGSEHNTWN